MRFDFRLYLRFVLFMFSAEEVLLLRQSAFKGWKVMFKCDSCQYKSPVQLPAVPGDPVLAVIVARVRCGLCHRKPSAAMLTNVRDWGKVQFWRSYESSQGDVYVLLWAPRD